MRHFIDSYFQSVVSSIQTIESKTVSRLSEEIYRVWEQEGTIYIMGNGGSASTASHFACDLSKLTVSGFRKRLKVMALTDNMPIITAWANDTHYENIFVEQLIPFLGSKDLVIAISASGNSKNIVKALDYANSLGAKTAALSGFKGGQAGRISYYPLITFSDNMQVIEDSHSLLCHGIALEVCSLLDQFQPQAAMERGV
ncbi:SIS domain-containing protein [Paenibacillus sp. NPDC058071]|uniref:SIS domain-containing protein n=1 Tax=Paenibacillus sp. NPDC058071 TaxID=3346326 RepID=UPI0036DE8ADE